MGMYAAIMFMAIAIAVIAKFGIKKEWQVFIFIIAVTIITSIISAFTSSEFHWQESVLSAFFAIVGALFYWFFLKKAVMRNMLSLLILLYYNQMASGLKELIECGWTIIPFDICALILIALLPIFYVIFLKIKSSSKKDNVAI